MCASYPVSPRPWRKITWKYKQTSMSLFISMWYIVLKSCTLTPSCSQPNYYHHYYYSVRIRTLVLLHTFVPPDKPLFIKLHIFISVQFLTVATSVYTQIISQSVPLLPTGNHRTTADNMLFRWVCVQLAEMFPFQL